MTMMRKYIGVATVAVAMGACATKGYVRTQVQAAQDSARLAWSAGDSTLKNDLSTMSGQFASLRTEVDSVKQSVATLQQDLNALRDSLGAKITAMENATQFVFPVTFAFDDATVQESARPALDRFAQVVNRHYGGSLVTVEGFADPAGSAAYNRRLSQERAENVIAYLQQAGLTGVTLRPVGLGETRLVVEDAWNDMPGAESNRRVVFVIESVGGEQQATTAARQ